MTTEEAFNLFLKDFTMQMKEKQTALYKASWELETTGSKLAANRLAELSKEFKIFLSNKEVYHKLLQIKDEGSITGLELLRILNDLIRTFKANQVPAELLSKIAEGEAELSRIYVEFRAHFEGKTVKENDLIDLLKTETNVKRRQEIWEATKQIGSQMAPKIIQLVKWRNQQAHRLGYSDYYQMQLELGEIDKKWLFSFLEQFNEMSKPVYADIYKELEEKLSKKYQVPPASLGPWAWGEPFCQEDPLETTVQDDILKNVNLLNAAKKFFGSMGFEIDSVLQRSDLYERNNKNQHAFCTHIDREGDIRILMNLRPNLKQLETLLHELGHAIYEQGLDPNLPWLLKCPPHMITTESIALLMGRFAYNPSYLKSLNNQADPEILKDIFKGLRRRQFIFSRWVLVMVHFEANLYQNPEQDLNQLWWSLVQKYQKICPSSHRAEKHDWACKYHVGLAPVYYHSYLLGEFLASMLFEYFQSECAEKPFYEISSIATTLNEKFFSPGNRYPWNRLIEHLFKNPLTYKPWIKEFNTYEV